MRVNHACKNVVCGEGQVLAPKRMHPALVDSLMCSQGQVLAPEGVNLTRYSVVCSDRVLERLVARSHLLALRISRLALPSQKVQQLGAVLQLCKFPDVRQRAVHVCDDGMSEHLHLAQQHRRCQVLCRVCLRRHRIMQRPVRVQSLLVLQISPVLTQYLSVKYFPLSIEAFCVE